VGATIRLRCASIEIALQFDPTMFPGKRIVPRSDGGVKIPSLRSGARRSRQAARSASLIPHTPASFCGTSGGFDVDGYVGHAVTPGTSLGGTLRSSTLMSGLPVARSRTNKLPILVA